MKHNTYQNAVNHLQFSNDLSERVARETVKPLHTYRLLRRAVLAAVMICLLATSALAVSPELRDWTVSLLKLGVSRQEMEDANVMEFRHDEAVDGVSVHYLELDKGNYTFYHGMLTSSQTGYLRITEDYRLETIEKQYISVSMEKNGRQYTVNRDYFETDAGIFTSAIYGLQKNDRGELFLNLTDGNSHQWPVYWNMETGAVRDALPDWTEEDFTGRVTYGYELMGGILITTIVDEDKLVDGNSVAYNMLYWIASGAEEAVQIDLPANHWMWYCENDELYYRDSYGRLYRLNESLAFELICDYATGDDLTNGLYTVVTENGNLGIVDVYRDKTYVISALAVDPGKPEGFNSRIGGDIDETMGYNAIRYNADGRIALVQTEWVPEEGRVALRKLGILDEETGALKLLEIENQYDGYHIRWLDETRLAVIYDEEYLCVYEFAE